MSALPSWQVIGLLGVGVGILAKALIGAWQAGEASWDESILTWEASNQSMTSKRKAHCGNCGMEKHSARTCPNIQGGNHGGK